MTQVENVTKVGNYRNTDIYFNAEQGEFYARPNGAKKDREAGHYWSVKRKIDEFFEQKAANLVARKQVSHPVRVYREGHVLIGNYVGARMKSTGKHDEGHAFTFDNTTKRNYGMKHQTVTYGTVKVIPDSVGDLQVAELVQARQTLEDARTALLKLERDLTVDVSMPSIGYNPTPLQMNDLQDMAVERLKEASARVLEKQEEN